MDVYYKCPNVYLRNRYTFLVRSECSSVTQGSHSRQWAPCFWWLVKTLAWKPHNHTITTRLLKCKTTLIHPLNTCNSWNNNPYSLYYNIAHNNMPWFKKEMLWTENVFYLCVYLTDLQWYQQRGYGCRTKGEPQSSCSESGYPSYQNRSLKWSLNTHGSKGYTYMLHKGCTHIWSKGLIWMVKRMKGLNLLVQKQRFYNFYSTHCNFK